MTSTSRPAALVTGASAGIGLAFAEQLAQEGYDLLITARRSERLAAIADALTARHGVRVEVLSADLADPTAPARLASAVSERGLALEVLVNNAGYSINQGFRHTHWAQNEAFLRVMVHAVAELTHACVPGMVARGRGHVVHVASLAGLIHGAPGSTLYAASKAFLVRFAESLSLELEGTGVTATALCPGYTYSEFHDVAGTRARVQALPRIAWTDADEVAKQGLRAARRGDAVCIPGAFNRAVELGLRFLPRAIARGVMRKQARRFRDYA